ncbi:MAG: GNAT family N-acetyltransferase [Ilumatobacter sp.]|uniref:GNAT family N-acetyltransferase n=1 Tax=Ilumatobacter sp. TaxID=1967498 RepID=UPI003298E1DD
MDEIELRPATPDDADAVEAYHARCFEKTYASQLLVGDVEPPDRDGMRRQFRDWFRPDSDVDTRVVVVDGAPIAHFTVSGNRLVHLFIEPAHHGQGLGRRLLVMVESMLADAGHSEFELHTRVDNVPAISFYEKAGWTVTDQLIRTVEHGITYEEYVLVKHRT